MSTIQQVLSVLTLGGVAFAWARFIWHRAQYEKGMLSEIAGFRKDFDGALGEILSLRSVTIEHEKLHARTVAQLDGIEDRVSRIERVLDK